MLFEIGTWDTLKLLALESRELLLIPDFDKFKLCVSRHFIIYVFLSRKSITSLQNHSEN